MKNHSIDKPSSSFHAVVEAADQLTAAEQEVLLEVITRRLADRRRSELVSDVRAARREFATGKLRPSRVDQIMNEILP